MTDRALVPAESSTPDLSWLYAEEKPERDYLQPEVDEDYVEAAPIDPEEVSEIVDELEAEHGLRIGQAREMCEAYDGDRPGYFLEDQEEIENGVIETMSIDTLRQMHDFRCGLIAMYEPYAKLLNREANDRDEAMAVEELVQFDFKCEERQFAEQWGSDLRLAEPAHLQRYGMLVGYDGLNPRDQYCGLSMSLVDPTTVYPVFAGAGGLVELYRVYEDTADNIAGNYGGKPGFPEYKRIADTLRKHEGKKSDVSSSRRTELRTVAEGWNGDHVTVVVDDDIPIVQRKHGYHEVPFTVIGGAFDLPAATTSGFGRDPEYLSTDSGEVVVNDASIDTARRYRPYDWKRLRSHRISEAVAGRQLTTFKWAIDPTKVLEKDPLSKNKQQEIGKLRPGKTIEVMIPNKLNLITPVVDPQAMAGLNMALAANAQNGILGQLASGTVPPQTSGSALNAMIEIGGASDAVLVRLIQLFKRLRAEKRLRLRYGFGGMLGREREKGAWTIPDSRGYARTPFHRVTPDMIERTGIELDVELFNWRPDVTAAQYFSVLRAPHATTGLPLYSDDTIRRRLKTVPDPDREAERIEDEQLLAHPAIAQQKKLRRLRRERDAALAEGDDESADDAQAASLQLEFMFEQEVLQGRAAPVGQPGMNGGGQAQLPMESDPGIQLPGTSLPAQGIDVGHQGARPVEDMAAMPQPQAMTPIGSPREGY